MAAPETHDGWHYERTLYAAGFTPVAGVDEAGRGAWAGPVTAAAVVLPHAKHAFVDSKRLTPARRQVLADEVRRVALAFSVVHAPASLVDDIGVLEATRWAVRRCVTTLHVPPAALVTDYLTRVGLPVRAPAKGEHVSWQVAAASLLAKTERDRYMTDVAHAADDRFGFAGHKGYGAAAHRKALAKFGPSREHRKTFAPVRSLLKGADPVHEAGRSNVTENGLF